MLVGSVVFQEVSFLGYLQNLLLDLLRFLCDLLIGQFRFHRDLLLGLVWFLEVSFHRESHPDSVWFQEVSFLCCLQAVLFRLPEYSFHSSFQ